MLVSSQQQVSFTRSGAPDRDKLRSDLSLAARPPPRCFSQIIVAVPLLFPTSLSSPKTVLPAQSYTGRSARGSFGTNSVSNHPTARFALKPCALTRASRMASLCSVSGAVLFTLGATRLPCSRNCSLFSRRSSLTLADRSSLAWTVAKTKTVTKDWRHSAVAHPSAALDTPLHEFVDDGAEVEVRVRIPDGMVGEDDATVSARHVQVDSQDDALFIAVRTPNGPRMICSATRLYGRVKSSESVWYIDGGEIVLSLRKMDSDVIWPSLEEEWGSLTVGVSQLLKGTSVYIVGSSSEVNWAIAKELATGLEYVPLQTQQLVQDYTNKSPAELAAEEGDQSVSDTESAILDSLSSHVRCVVATLGGSQGVGAQYGNWKSLHAGFTVWVNLTTATDEGAAEAEAAKAKQGGSQAYAQADVVVALGGWDENAAKPAAEGALRALKALLEADKELPSKKSLYCRLGCRGDWPNIMPPGWNPLSGKEEAKSTAYY